MCSRSSEMTQDTQGNNQPSANKGGTGDDVTQNISER